MPVKRYEIWIDEDNLIFVYFTTIKGEIVDFVVKYISYIDEELYEILRYDCGHGVPHIDVLDPKGNTIEKQWLPHLNFKQALTSARYDIEHNYTFYRERFIKWLKEKN